MFVAQAHSFTQQARLAITLAWVAGYTNLVSILAVGTVTSHVSGTTSDLGHDLADGRWDLAVGAGALLATFFLGAVISGLATELGRRRGWESIYVLPMAAQALLLGAFAVAVEFREPGAPLPAVGFAWIACIASMAMGVQNATITRISSGVVRTTHVTGVLTDLGMEFAQFALWLSDRRRDFPPGTARGLVHSVRHHPTGRRLALLASILGSFAIGAMLGTWLYAWAPRWVMFPPVLFLLWIIVQDIRTPIVEIEPSDLVGGDARLDLPRALAVFHLRRDPSKPGRVHRMPDLLAWSDRLPPSTLVVILDLGEVAQMDANSAMEVRAVLDRFAAQGRRLVLAGVTVEQYEQMRDAKQGVRLDPGDVLTDLELAIARGLNLVEDAMTGSRRGSAPPGGPGRAG